MWIPAQPSQACSITKDLRETHRYCKMIHSISLFPFPFPFHHHFHFHYHYHSLLPLYCLSTGLSPWSRYPRFMISSLLQHPLIFSYCSHRSCHSSHFKPSQVKSNKGQDWIISPIPEITTIMRHPTWQQYRPSEPWWIGNDMTIRQHQRVACFIWTPSVYSHGFI